MQKNPTSGFREKTEWDFIHVSNRKNQCITLPIKIPSLTDLIPYGCIDFFVIKTHVDTPIKVSSNRTLSLRKYPFWVEIIPLPRLVDLGVYLIFPSFLDLNERDREDLDPVGR